MLLFSCQVVSDSLRPQRLQHTRLLCPPLFPRVCPNSYQMISWGNRRPQLGKGRDLDPPDPTQTQGLPHTAGCVHLARVFQLVETQAQGLIHRPRMGSRTEPTPFQLGNFALEVGLRQRLAWWGGGGGVAMAGVSHLDQFRSRPRGPRRHLKGHWQAGQGWPSWRVGGLDQRRG